MQPLFHLSLPIQENVLHFQVHFVISVGVIGQFNIHCGNVVFIGPICKCPGILTSRPGN
jgi:hypothetical protein